MLLDRHRCSSSVELFFLLHHYYAAPFEMDFFCLLEIGLKFHDFLAPQSNWILCKLPFDLDNDDDDGRKDGRVLFFPISNLRIIFGIKKLFELQFRNCKQSLVHITFYLRNCYMRIDRVTPLIQTWKSSEIPYTCAALKSFVVPYFYLEFVKKLNIAYICWA